MTIRWAKGPYRGAADGCQTGMVIGSGRARPLGWPNKPQIWCSQSLGVREVAFSWFSLFPAPASSSARGLGRDGLCALSCWATSKPTMPGEQAPLRSLGLSAARGKAQASSWVAETPADTCPGALAQGEESIHSAPKGKKGEAGSALGGWGAWLREQM